MNHATSADGTRVAWTAEGSGPAVLLVHGITENLRVWDPVARRLTGERTVVRLDLRGHGASGRADGYGLGLAIAQQAARLHSDRIEVESFPGRGSRFVLHLPTGAAQAR